MNYLVFKIVNSYYEDFTSNFSITFEKFFGDFISKEQLREFLQKVLFEVRLEENYIKKILVIQEKQLKKEELESFNLEYDKIMNEKIGKHKH